MKTVFISLVGALLLSACSTQGEGEAWSPAWKKAFQKNAEESTRPVYTKQDRNGSCWSTDDCIAGLSCVGAADSTPGTCQNVCAADADCGNGFLCRSGSCQKDCSELNEKCSDRRLCCFFDQNSDRVNDSACRNNDAGEKRCAVLVESNIEGGSSASEEVPLE
ncbi:MAG TPA: hypothetical protein VJB82_01380 [Candidatus Peribacterales bacterium]|nr:hypothetical protein [Candidatus Peribacterales bacterium]